MRLNQVNTLRNKYGTAMERVMADLKKVYPGEEFMWQDVATAILYFSPKTAKGPDARTLIRVLVLRYQDLKSHAEIARILHYDYSTIQRYISIVLKKIKEAKKFRERTNNNERNQD